MGGNFRVFYKKYHVICKKWQFYFFPSNLDAFISFSCLIVVSRTFNTKLNRSGESGHPCLVPEFREKTFSFSLLSTMLAVCLSEMAFIILRCIPFISTLMRTFIMNGCWILSNAIFRPIEIIVWFLYCFLLMWCITLTDLQMLNHPYILEINPTWSWYMTPFIYCWIRFADILLRIFYLYSSKILAWNFLFL